MRQRVTPGAEEVRPDLEQRHRDAILDVVLSWATLDGALGILLAATEDTELDVAAAEFGKRPSSDKLAKLRRSLEEEEAGNSASKSFRKLKKELEKNAFVRNRIVHSRCIGVWEKDADFVLFAAFERVSDGRLALDAIPLEEMPRVTNWA